MAAAAARMNGNAPSCAMIEPLPRPSVQLYDSTEKFTNALPMTPKSEFSEANSSIVHPTRSKVEAAVAGRTENMTVTTRPEYAAAAVGSSTCRVGMLAKLIKSVLEQLKV